MFRKISVIFSFNFHINEKKDICQIINDLLADIFLIFFSVDTAILLFPA